MKINTTFLALGKPNTGKNGVEYYSANLVIEGQFCSCRISSEAYQSLLEIEPSQALPKAVFEVRPSFKFRNPELYLVSVE